MDIYKELADIQRKMDLLLKINGGDTLPMTVKAVAEMYGKPRTSMYTTYRYLLPNFGIDSNGNVVNEWTRAEILEWNSRPLSERKSELKARIFPVNKKG